MKLFLAAALLVASSLAFAHDDTHHDTLTINTSMYSSTLTGNITVFDHEDAIGQVEINQAGIETFLYDDIFKNGFEASNVNWIWIGEYTDGTEFGVAAHCSHQTNSTEHDNLHVVLWDCVVDQSEGIQ